MSSSKRTILMTGATGFLGHFVLRDLLQKNFRVVALLRHPVAETAGRLRAMLSRLGVDSRAAEAGGQLLLQEGGLPDDLPESTWGETSEILSCAASLQLFSNGNGEPFRTNMLGTEMLIEWARRYGVGRIHAVSTAYVCGSYKDDVREIFHPRPPDFQTEYEYSKWMAEDMLARWAHQDSGVLTVLRPSFLIGDSETGYTCQFGGFYQFARLVSMMKERYADLPGQNGNGTLVPHRIPGSEHDLIQNLVPVDFAARIIAEVVADHSLQGRVYHLTDPAPPTWGEFKQWIEEYFHIHGGQFVDRGEFLGEHTPAESLLWEKYDLLMPRLQHQIRFDQEHTQDVMRRRNVGFPSLTRERMKILLDYAASQRWGQRARSTAARAGRDDALTH